MNLANKISYEKQIDKFFRIFKLLPYRKASPIYALGNQLPTSFSRGQNRIGFDLYDSRTSKHIYRLSHWQIEHFSPLLFGVNMSIETFRNIAGERHAFIDADIFLEYMTYDYNMQVSDIHKVLDTIKGG